VSGHAEARRKEVGDGDEHDVRVRLAAAILRREVLAVVDRDDERADGLGVCLTAKVGCVRRGPGAREQGARRGAPPMAAPESISWRLSVMLFGATNSAVPAAMAILTKDETIGRSSTLGRATTVRETRQCNRDARQSAQRRTSGHGDNGNLDGRLRGKEEWVRVSRRREDGHNRKRLGTHDAHECERAVADVREDGDELQTEADGADEALDLDPERDYVRSRSETATLVQGEAGVV
jgi:hypothetical protein